MKQPPWLLAPPGDLAVGAEVVLDHEEARHATSVLRLSTGSPVVLTDAAGRIANGTLSATGRGRAEVAVETVESAPPLPGDLTLAIGVLAGSAMDVVVQKAVELGVARLIPVVCRRSQHGSRRVVKRMDHWSRVGRQSLKQCHRAWSMEIEPPIAIADLVAGIDGGRGIVADPDGHGIGLLTPTDQPVLLVGPEGGFDSEEHGLLATAGWQRLRLGPFILRAETAAVAGSALLADARPAEPSHS